MMLHYCWIDGQQGPVHFRGLTAGFAGSPWFAGQNCCKDGMLRAALYVLVLELGMDRLGLQQCDEAGRIYSDQIAPAPAIEQNAWQCQDAGLHIDRHGAPGTEGRGAAYLIAGMALGHVGPAWRNSLVPGLARQVLGRDLAVAVHQYHQRAGILVLHDQRLHHGMWILVQLARGFPGAAVIDVIVGMFRERYVVAAQEIGSGGGRDVFLFAHDVCRLASAARMVLRMQRFQALARHMGIDLRGGNIGVAKQHLNHAQVCAVVQQVGRESVSHHVRR